MQSMKKSAAELLDVENPSEKEVLSAVFRLALPAILAQIAETVMQYIDSAMVGQMGRNASASIGLVASSTWLFGGLMTACCFGFSVQVAQSIGAKDTQRAKNIFRQSIAASMLFAVILAAIGCLCAFYLPAWMKADMDIRPDATRYFLIFSLFIPVRLLYLLAASMLECSGNMKTPSFLGILMCALDVVFNAFLIFPGFSISSLRLPGAGLGVTGAALGTALAYLTAAVGMFYAAAVKSPLLNLREKGSWKVEKKTLKKALDIGVPMAAEQAVLSFAQILYTRIISPLGAASIAAHSFAVTAESFCYLPGYGIGSAATTLVGQAAGARRRDLAKRFAWTAAILGMALMAACGLVMYAAAPQVFAFLTQDPEVQALGVQCLRIELHVEALFAASIVTAGALRGVGDTMVPFLMNLVSMWGIRLTLAWFLVQWMGLPGAWYAMAAEISARGVLFLIRLLRGKWLQMIPEPSGSSDAPAARD